ncbi:tyrosine-type recombinase/integrase [Bacillus sp. ISL-37]|uniref:tyrosine-type recombinase/integrase n=1 Tax=Bacillus sp. ISL-37 TaxID=2819123 RepID=UPI002570C3A3|nr:tyrosine-type recombinase/integrase [Bacillus sp. ISL-37]
MEIKKISARASINRETHPHQLSHIYATHLFNNGAPVEVIQSLLSHVNLTILSSTDRRHQIKPISSG